LKQVPTRELWAELLDDCGTEVVNAVGRERGVHRRRWSVEGSRALRACGGASPWRQAARRS
jgi:hypothetical protein